MKYLNVRNCTSFTAFLLFLRFSFACAEPIRIPHTAKVGIHKSGANLLYVNTQQGLTTTTTDSIQNQDVLNVIDRTDENVIDLGDATSPPFIPLNEEIIPTVALGQETADDSNNLVNNLQVQTEVPASQSLSVDLPLFYPPQPAETPKYRPDTHYGPPRETYNPQPRRRYNSKDSSLIRPFASTLFKPNMFGFPPISNTRENVGLQVNWGAKIGRAHRSFYDFLMV